MATKSRPSEALAVDRPEGFLRRERIAQRVGTGVLAIFVIAGAAGLFGDGPLSHVTATSDAVTVSYERFARQAFRTELDIEARVGSDDVTEIRVAREFLNNIDVLEVRPIGALNRLDESVAVFEVPAKDGKAFLQLRYEPKRYGVLETDVGVTNGAPAHVRQIVFF